VAENARVNVALASKPSPRGYGGAGNRGSCTFPQSKFSSVRHRRGPGGWGGDRARRGIPRPVSRQQLTERGGDGMAGEAAAAAAQGGGRRKQILGDLVKDGVRAWRERVTSEKHRPNRDSQNDTDLTLTLAGRRGVGGRRCALARPNRDRASVDRGVPARRTRGPVFCRGRGSEGRVHYQGGRLRVSDDWDNPSGQRQQRPTPRSHRKRQKYTWLGPVTRSAVRTSSSFLEFHQVAAATRHNPESRTGRPKLIRGSRSTGGGGGGQKLWRRGRRLPASRSRARGVAGGRRS